MSCVGNRYLFPVMMSTQFPWLTTIILLPLLAALAIPVLPDKEGRTVRWYALGVGMADFALMVYAFWQNYDLQNYTFQLVESYTWVPQLGLNWSVAVDGLSMPLVLLTGLINTLAMLAAWNVRLKPRLFYFLMLAMYSAQIGVFAAQDMLLFFLMWELELVPVYLLISIWGGQKRRYAGVTYERTHTLVMDKMGGMAKTMPKVFALFTAGSMASLALPGMSGFVGELTIFLGMTMSDAYNPTFKVVVVLLAAVGVILTPVYLLSMLRQVFYGANNSGLVIEEYVSDAKPREVFIAICLLIPIIGVGFYPKLATQTYDVKTVAVATAVRNVLPALVAQQPRSPLYSTVLVAPQLAESQSRTIR